ncbi:MAG TPA: hypothetical protein VMU37_04580 [Caulobacteraceae bacterium]|nr:hypothetical protein [Caulobacteraceae bacterium]
MGVDCPRAGGKYRIDVSYAVGGSRRVPPDARARLTTWLVNQRRMGEPIPFATQQVILEAGAAPAMRATDKIERFFLALASVNYDPVKNFKLSGQIDDEQKKWANLFGAWTEHPHENGGMEIVRFLNDNGWIEALASTGSYRLTAKGLGEFGRVTAGRTQFDQGFVAMWFGDELRPIYDDGFKLGIEEAGYRAMRIDRKEHNNKIDDEIIAEIRRSRFLIADVTCPIVPVKGRNEALARGGVYYEAGFAQGLNMPVIWTAREGMADHLHFDTRQYPHIIWKDAADLRKRLKVRIGAVLGYGPRTT